MAAGLLKECGLSENFAGQALKPLFMGNAENIAANGVVQALTGPVERADAGTIEKHLTSLEGDAKEIYRLLSCRLVDVAKQKNPDRDYRELSMLLEN